MSSETFCMYIFATIANEVCWKACDMVSRSECIDGQAELLIEPCEITVAVRSITIIQVEIIDERQRCSWML